jgi:hypothetical protein
LLVGDGAVLGEDVQGGGGVVGVVECMGVGDEDIVRGVLGLLCGEEKGGCVSEDSRGCVGVCLDLVEEKGGLFRVGEWRLVRRCWR